MFLVQYNLSMRYYGILLLHILLIAAAAISPFFIDWRLVVIGAVGYMIAGEIFQYCPLTVWQFGGTKMSLYQYYLGKMGIRLTRNQTILLVRYGLPATVALCAFYFQVIILQH